MSVDTAHDITRRELEERGFVFTGASEEAFKPFLPLPWVAPPEVHSYDGIGEGRVEDVDVTVLLYTHFQSSQSGNRLLHKVAAVVHDDSITGGARISSRMRQKLRELTSYGSGLVKTLRILGLLVIFAILLPLLPVLAMVWLVWRMRGTIGASRAIDDPEMEGLFRIEGESDAAAAAAIPTALRRHLIDDYVYGTLVLQPGRAMRLVPVASLRLLPYELTTQLDALVRALTA